MTLSEYKKRFPKKAINWNEINEKFNKNGSIKKPIDEVEEKLKNQLIWLQDIRNK